MRAAILGNAGSGKSTLARRLADAHGLPLHEVDRQQGLPTGRWSTRPPTAPPMTR